jgi:hypothetical protein
MMASVVLLLVYYHSQTGERALSELARLVLPGGGK